MVDRQDSGQEEKIENLYKSIGELKVENDWLKKIATFGLKERKSLIDRKDNKYSLRVHPEGLHPEGHSVVY